MSAGTMSLVCLLVAAQAGGSEPVHMNQTRFSIPIRINPERRAEIKELVLCASRDQGQSWDSVSRVQPGVPAFPFYAQGDGPYWFAVVVVDKNGQQEPADPRTAPNIQKIVVDTTRPEARLLAVERDRLGEEVVVRYEIRDENLDPATIKLEYLVAGSPSPFGTPVALSGPQGEAKFRPGSGSGLVVRLSAKDRAGNEGTTQHELAPLTTTLAGGTGTTPQPSPAPLPGTGVAPLAQGPTPQPLVPGQPALAPQPQPQPATGQEPYAQGQFPPLPAGPGPAPVQPLVQNNQPLPQYRPQDPPGQPLAHTGGLTQVSTATNPGPIGYAPVVEITNKKVIKVDFEVAKFGPSGLGKVDVYLTGDDGRTWEKSPGDHKAIMPNPGEVRGASGPLQGSVMVPLPRDGVPYGITLVVHSRAGLSRPAPQPGDPPQMRIELDTLAPEAELYSPRPDEGRPNSLVMLWKATDKNLATNPVTLEWSPQRNGPWTPIGAAELPNTGKYTWQVTPDVPPSVFLRLTVRDAAGNTGVAQTQEPVLVDLSVPEVNIIRRPAGASNR